ncbi:hypothetical protein O1L55_16055 [Streptomyces albulus]|nr:hypothetical protein [Streptomyces noursei]
MSHPEEPGRDATGADDLVMFWNLYEAGVDRHYGRDERWHLQRDLVREHRPRVLMTTEGWAWQFNDRAFFEDAKSALDMDGVLFPAKTGCNLAVFWQHDVDLVAVEEVAPELAQWHGHGSATLQLPGRSAPVRFVVAHLDPFSATNRRIESDHLRQYADPEAPHPTLLAMDANTVPPGTLSRTGPPRPATGAPTTRCPARTTRTGPRCGACSAPRRNRCSSTRAPTAATGHRPSASTRRARRPDASTCSC